MLTLNISISYQSQSCLYTNITCRHLILLDIWLGIMFFLLQSKRNLFQLRCPLLNNDNDTALLLVQPMLSKIAYITNFNHIFLPIITVIIIWLYILGYKFRFFIIWLYPKLFLQYFVDAMLVYTWNATKSKLYGNIKSLMIKMIFFILEWNYCKISFWMSLGRCLSFFQERTNYFYAKCSNTYHISCFSCVSDVSGNLCLGK